MYQPIASLRILLAASLIGGLASLSASCGSEAPPMGAAVENRDSLPVMVTRGVSKLISDSGVMRYKFITEEWRIYDKTTPPRWEFLKGIFIERYNDKFKVNMHITADSAWFYDQKVWKLRGNVELHDEEVETRLTTNELYWNMNTGELWSNVYTKLVEPNQAIEGNWFRARIVDKRLTSYHVKQSKGFMPSGSVTTASVAEPVAPQSETTDTLAPADTVPLREAPVSHRKK